MVTRLAAVTVLLLTGTAGAIGPNDLDGTGRISIVPGWRYTTNSTFATRAQNAGTPLKSRSRGGPQLTASFGYSTTSSLELHIDLFAGGETLELENRGELTSITYGANIGMSLQWLIAERVVPRLGISTGPTLVYVRGAGLEVPSERFTNAYSLTSGLTWRLSDNWGLQLDARLMLARGWVPGLSSVNGGGLWAGMGVTYTFASDGDKRSRPGLGW